MAKQAIMRVIWGASLIWAALAAAAQAQTGTVQGTITDPSGAVIPTATITLSNKDHFSRSTASRGNGTYSLDRLEPGRYTISATAQGFAPFAVQNVMVSSGKVVIQNITLKIPVQTQQVTVNDQTLTVDTSAEDNTNSTVIKGKDLDALSDDPDDLQNELTALAGPSAGPNGGQIYIDGFSGGQLPPKSSIREIRVNQNPFSAEYDQLGYGRIQIMTKPGTEKLHGMFMMNGNDSAFNSLNPFVASEPPYYSTFLMGNVSGALTKTSSFFVSVFDRNNQSNSIINTPYFDRATGLSETYSEALANPQSRLDFSPRFDFQLGAKNTLSARYMFDRQNDTNDGITTFTLPIQAYNMSSTGNTLQINDTQMISAGVVNETHFQYMRNSSNQAAQNNTPTVMVEGAFTSGGNSMGVIRDLQNGYELQNNTIVSKGAHAINFGGRLRFTRDSNYTMSGTNGQYIYTSLAAYQAETPAQYTVTLVNSPAALADYYDVGLYYQDDYKWRPNFTLSYGLRYETQNWIGDHNDWAPRLSFAWAPGTRGNKQGKTVIRGGYGWFYTRFAETNILNAIRQNGVNQQQYVINAPGFYEADGNPTPGSPLFTSSSTASPAIYRIAPNLKAALTMEAAVGVERTVGRFATVSATYINSRGVHQFLSDNINAYDPATYSCTSAPPVTCTGTRPLGGNDNIYEYESGGVFNQNQLTVNYSVSAKHVSLFGFYMLNFANADTSGPSYFPSNQTDPGADYGRASFDVRSRFLLGGNLTGPFGVSFSPMMVYNSGSPFNVTIGTDNGDNQYNQRPAYATAGTVNPVTTAYGTFDLNPAWNQARIPYDLGTGPHQFSMNIRVAKTFGVGPKVTGGSNSGFGFPGGGPPPGGPPPGGHGPGGMGGLGPGGLSGNSGRNPFMMGQMVPRRYSLTFAAMGRNIFNNVNLAAPMGVLESPLFGESNALAGGFFASAASNRSIDLQVSFSF